jgi:hypothetical protein
MRRFLMIAAAASIALVGLSANQCGGAEDKAAAPEAPPADAAPPAADAAPAAPPADDMSSETPAE